MKNLDDVFSLPNKNKFTYKHYMYKRDRTVYVDVKTEISYFSFYTQLQNKKLAYVQNT